ncbi:beta-lactamase/transpeptidase-like protein [Pseudovirgaria hyperparasitica]|uniref:Beta-lactamase/transpeptidase-like protein n=1 Tax=Pseudovirgaria hyperparasitica TaxID=470096 RepID=A0A6A6VZI0_9PEZI|nr:beta-lactamase/transpeptidase-like protein [Pseudovirgaria hyperparasitica]KAF2755289.1 beta-lactamase/transpeptidase-like protein [Pseudovirgaria hyperparasitica]
MSSRAAKGASQTSHVDSGDSSPVNVINAVLATTQPPPETAAAVWTRRWVVLSFWSIVVFLGLPIWWKTTAIYRATLPLDTMKEWADGKICKPVFPLRIAVDVPSMPLHDAQHLIRITQHALDDLNEFSAHHLRLVLTETSTTANGTTHTVRDGSRMGIDSAYDGDGEDTALWVKLLPATEGPTPRSELQAFKAAVDIFYSPNQVPSASSTSSPLGTFLANELHVLFEEEQAMLIHTFTSNTATHGGKAQVLSPERASALARQSTRAFKYAPTYHLTFSLFTPTAVPSDWAIESALKEYVEPLLEALSTISKFTVDTQVQLYATISPSIRQPEYDEEANAWTLRKEDLSGFINAAEWPLSPSIGAGPTVNFVIYVPSPDQGPLVVKVKENGGNSWLIPQWGGVLILNPESGQNKTTTLSKDTLRPAMLSFSNQLLALLGLPESPASLPLRLSTLTRVRAASLLFSASSTLGALARLTQQLSSIAIPDSVAGSVDATIQHLGSACDALHKGQFHSALQHARIAETEAEKAFFERSMVGMVYFPDEHKVAVYLPLLGPVAVPLLMAGIKEVMSLLQKRKTSCRSEAACANLPKPTLCILPFVPSRPSPLSSNMALSAQSVANIKAILNGTTSNKKAGIPALAFVAVDRNGKNLIAETSGTRGLEDKRPVDLDTMFWIASCTKMVTAIAAMQLVEQGKLALDDHEAVYALCPELKEKKVLMDDGTLAERTAEITLRRLLTHTAGFGYSFLNRKLTLWARPAGIDELSADANDFLGTPLVNQPGERWEYGPNIDWVGELISRATGLSLSDYFETHIFTPLGLKDITFFPTPAQQTNFARMTQHWKDGTAEEVDHTARRALTAHTPARRATLFQAGGSGLYAKPLAFAQILTVLINDGVHAPSGTRLLSPASIHEIWTNQIPDKPDFARGLAASAKEHVTLSNAEMFPQPGRPAQGWGLCGMITEEGVFTGRSAGSVFWVGVANLFWVADREKGVAHFIAGQVAPFGVPAVAHAWLGVEKALYDGLKDGGG